MNIFSISILFMSLTINSMSYTLLTPKHNFYVSLTPMHNYRWNIRNLRLLKCHNDNNKHDADIKINKFLSKCRHWLRHDFSEIVSNVNPLKLKNSISFTSEGMLLGMNSLMKNLNVGKKGYRGEELIAIQFILVLFQIFGLPSFLKLLFVTASFFLYISGLYLFLSSLWDTRSCLSIFLTPGLNHNLIMTGPYAIIRHPMYLGISLMSLSSSVLSKDVYKLITTLILIVIFYKSASQEEFALREKYLSDYENYAQDKYKIIPLIN